MHGYQINKDKANRHQRQTRLHAQKKTSVHSSTKNNPVTIKTKDSSRHIQFSSFSDFTHCSDKSETHFQKPSHLNMKASRVKKEDYSRFLEDDVFVEESSQTQSLSGDGSFTLVQISNVIGNKENVGQSNVDDLNDSHPLFKRAEDNQHVQEDPKTVTKSSTCDENDLINIVTHSKPVLDDKGHRDLEKIDITKSGLQHSRFESLATQSSNIVRVISKPSFSASERLRGPSRQRSVSCGSEICHTDPSLSGYSSSLPEDAVVVPCSPVVTPTLLSPSPIRPPVSASTAVSTNTSVGAALHRRSSDSDLGTPPRGW